MGCVCSRQQEEPTSGSGMPPVQVRVASTIGDKAAASPVQKANGEPLMLDRADTWEPNSASGGSPGKQDSADQFKIKSKGNEGLQEYVDDVKLSNKGMRGKFGKPSAVHQRKPSTIAEDSTNDVLAPPLEAASAANAAQPASGGDPSVRSEGGDPSVRSVLRGGRALSGADSVQPVNTLARMRGTGDSFDLARRETGDPSVHAVGWAHGPDSRQPAALAQQAQPLHTPMATVSAVELRDAQQEAAELPGALNPKEGGDAAPAATEGGDEGLPSPSGRRQLAPVRPKHTFAAGSQKRNVLGSMYLPAMAQSNINRPTYAQDAVDDEDSSEHPRHHDLYRQESVVEDAGPGRGGRGAYGSMVMGAKAHGLPALESDVQRNDLAPDMTNGTDADQRDIGSLTGWQAIANEVMGEMDPDEMENVEKEANNGNTDAGHDIGSLTGWQAIAAGVMAEAREDAEGGTEEAGQSQEGPGFMSQGQQPWNNGTFKMTGSPAEVKPLGAQLPRPRASVPVHVERSLGSVAPGAKKGGTFYVQYQEMEVLGEGAFGKALKCRRRRDNQMFVVKIMHESKMSEKAREEAKNEVKVLNSLNHPNIVKYYECYQERNMMHIIMELCEEGDLDTALKSHGGRYLAEDEIMLKFVQIALALHYTHSKGIIHRDLKANNIFCCSHGIVKLGDFGISKALGQQQNFARTMVGTPYYMSPEILKGRAYDSKTDVWAIGCVLYEMCALKKAFDASNLGAITVKIMSGKFPPIPAHYSDNLKALVEALIKKEPESRPDMQQILELEYVRRHMKAYSQHIARNITKRQLSFERSLTQFKLQDGEGLPTDPILAPLQAVLAADAQMGRAASQGSAGSLPSASSATSSRMQGMENAPSGALSSHGDGTPTGSPSRGDADAILNRRSLDNDSAKAAADARARVAADARRQAALQREAARKEARAREEADAMEHLRAFKESIKGAASRLGNKAASLLPGALQLPEGSAPTTPSMSVQSTPTGSVTFTASRRGSRSRFVAAGSRTGSQSEAADLKDASANLSRRISMFNAAASKPKAEEAEDDDIPVEESSESIDNLKRGVPAVLNQMQGILQKPAQPPGRLKRLGLR